MDKNRITGLVVLAQQGDSDAFGQLYEYYSREMFLYAVSMVHNEDSAEDAVSDAILEAIKGIKSLKNPESFKGWLFKILNISCRKQYNARMSEVLIDPETGTEIAENDSGIENAENAADLKNAMRVLTQEEREIVLRSVIEEYKSQEISEMLGIPAVTIRSKLSRALKKLRTAMEEGRKEAE